MHQVGLNGESGETKGGGPQGPPIPSPTSPPPPPAAVPVVPLPAAGRGGYGLMDVAMGPKNDFQTGVKRNLHSWAQWRTQVNNSLVTSLITGEPMRKVDSLDNYLQQQTDQRHPVENPKTLLTYSASKDTTTPLKRSHFLSFGIPRARCKQVPGSPSLDKSAIVPEDEMYQEDEEPDFDGDENDYDDQELGADFENYIGGRHDPSGRDTEETPYSPGTDDPFSPGPYSPGSNDTYSPGPFSPYSEDTYSPDPYSPDKKDPYSRELYPPDPRRVAEDPYSRVKKVTYAQDVKDPKERGKDRKEPDSKDHEDPYPRRRDLRYPRGEREPAGGRLPRANISTLERRPR